MTKTASSPPYPIFDVAQVLDLLAARAVTGRRVLIALAGPPAVGKTTCAALLAQGLTEAGLATCVVPMDGFHLDNATLTTQGLLARKGAPETFDINDLKSCIHVLHELKDATAPGFDRAGDHTVPNAIHIPHTCTHVICEGNYLLLDRPGWRDLHPLWDVTLALKAPEPLLRQRLIQRWLDHGLPADQAETRAETNDLVNARVVAEHSLPADLTQEIGT